MTIHGSKGMEHPVVIYPTKKGKTFPLSFWTDDPTDEDTEQRIAYVEGYENDFSFTDLCDDYQHKKQETVIDDLNVAYVAHTRAIELLYLVTEKKGENEKTNYFTILNDFVLHAKKEKGESFFEKDPEFASHYFSGDKNWKKGDETAKKIGATVVTPPMTISDFSLQTLVMPEVIPDDDPRSIGTKVHDCLSRFNSFPQNEEEAIMAGEKVPEDLRPYVMNFFHQILKDEELKRFFGPDAKVYNEVSILRPDGETKRPDRVAILDGKVRVYDYKTGHDDSKYQEQLDEYCRLIREMGYEDVQGRLLFVV
jgi:ATP-dependent exoDNAse (exonuclease V) beta subunit